MFVYLFIYECIFIQIIYIYLNVYLFKVYICIVFKYIYVTTYIYINTHISIEGLKCWESVSKPS